MKQKFWFKKIAGFIVIAVAGISLFGFVVMSLWNSVLTAVLPVKAITFRQALGIFVLSKILFGGFRGGWGGRRHAWGQKMKDKWQQMTPEEQQRFKEQWRNKCRPWGNRPTNEGEQL